jgi:hypothetical protein
MFILNRLMCVLGVFLMLFFMASDANAQNAPNDTDYNGVPIYNSDRSSTDTYTRRLDDANTKVGNAPAGYTFWMKYSDGKFEKGGMQGQNITISGAIVNSVPRVAWWNFWTSSNGCGGPPTITIIGKMVTTSVFVGQGQEPLWKTEFIATGVQITEAPSCNSGNSYT